MPTLSNDVDAFITRTVVSKRVPTDIGSQWQDKYLPSILKWLEDLVERGTVRDNDDALFVFTEDTRGINVPNEIKSQSKKIRLQLSMHFARNPPFTLLRICELVADPVKAGYDINLGNAAILKFFNSFAKLVVVSSTISDFPHETFSASENGHNDTDKIINGNSNGKESINASVAMVKIPWLENETKTSNETEELSDATSDSPISKENHDALKSEETVDVKSDEIGASKPEELVDVKSEEIAPKSDSEVETSKPQDQEQVVSITIATEEIIGNTNGEVQSATEIKVTSDPIDESPEPDDIDTIPTSPDMPSSVEDEDEDEEENNNEEQKELPLDTESDKRSASQAGLEEPKNVKRMATGEQE